MKIFHDQNNHKQWFHITFLLVLSDLNIKALSKISTDKVLCHYKCLVRLISSLSLLLGPSWIPLQFSTEIASRRPNPTTGHRGRTTVWEQTSAIPPGFWQLPPLPRTCILSCLKEKYSCRRLVIGSNYIEYRDFLV